MHVPVIQVERYLKDLARWWHAISDWLGNCDEHFSFFDGKLVAVSLRGTGTGNHDQHDFDFAPSL